MIEIASMHCGYGTKEVLQGISLHIKPGEMVGVLGPNGSGKTTLLLAISGVIPVRSGSIRIAGKDITSMGRREAARHVASVPQRSDISFPFRCLSVVLMGRYPHLDAWGGYSQDDIEISLDAMEETGVVQLAERPIREVSGGEAQAVTIARALAQQSAVLLMDEATSNLDVARKIRIFDLLGEKNSEGATLLCVMHDLNMAALYCSRLVFLKEGRVALDGLTDDVFNDENLSRIYGTRISVSKHPLTGTPQAHFVPRSNRGSGCGSVLVERA